MEKNKKIILIGAGVLGGVALAHFLSGRRPPQEWDTMCDGFDLYEYHSGEWVLVEENSTVCGWQPGEPEEAGIIQGYVVDGETGEHIPSAAIYLDGKFALYSWTSDVGGYRIGNIPYGTHTVTVEANNYQTTDFEILVDQPIQSKILKMPPLPPGPPGEWSDGVVVQKISAEPSLAYLGETINLDVYIQYGIGNPSQYPTPATIFGTVKVNGQKIREEFYIDYRNPTLRFQHEATQIGEFTAIAQDKSTKFTVVESPIAQYYPPHGGNRFPVCTELTIPGIGTLTPKDWWGIERAGWGNTFRTQNRELIDLLSKAYPSAWNPSDVIVRKWEMLIPPTNPYAPYEQQYGQQIFIIPTDYDCPQYWPSKEELAGAIAETKTAIPELPYGLADQFEVWMAQFGPRNSLFVGYRDWVGTTYTSSGFQGHVDAKLHCPYCSGGITWGNHSPIPALDMARQLLEHIEAEHPEHPLTQPAWF
jgi:hypothetical protein